MVPVSVWIVFMGIRGQSLLRSFSDKFHLGLSPALLHDAVNLVTPHGFYTTEHCILTRQSPSPPPSFMTALVYLPCPGPVCKAYAHEMCLWRRVRALAFASCGAWLLTGTLSSDPLFLGSIWANERIPAVSTQFLWHVCATTHTHPSRYFWIPSHYPASSRATWRNLASLDFGCCMMGQQQGLENIGSQAIMWEQLMFSNHGLDVEGNISCTGKPTSDENGGVFNWIYQNDILLPKTTRYNVGPTAAPGIVFWQMSSNFLLAAKKNWVSWSYTIINKIS